MTQPTYRLLESYMLSCMQDSAHDKEHIYRVLYHALEIAKSEQNVDYDVLIAACLLHDIGRQEEYDNPTLCHAMIGGKKAFIFLTEHGFEKDFAHRVKACIQSHRYRKECLPQSLEAKILFDADKLDVAGAMGIARTLLYQGRVGEPLYTLLPDGQVSSGDGDTVPSFFQEYKYKLEQLCDHFCTSRGAELARTRQPAAAAFYNALRYEADTAYKHGKDALSRLID